MIKRVLVTGAGGFVGSHLVETLLRVGHDVVAVDSFRDNGTSDKLLDASYGQLVDGRTLEVFTHDLRAPLSRRSIELMRPIDVVLDVASRSSVDQSISEPREFIEGNVAVTLTTLEAARVLRPSRYVHVSTDEVFGDNLTPCSPTDQRPSSPYAASKAAQNDVCRAYARTYGVPLTIVTSSNMFGERQSQLAFTPRVIRAALADASELFIHTFNGIVGSRHYNYVRDVAEVVTSWVGDDARSWPSHVALPGRYHVQNDALTRKILNHVAQVTGRHCDVRLNYVDATRVRPGYDATYPQLNDAQPDWLDQAPPLDDCLARTVRWFVEHPEWLT